MKYGVQGLRGLSGPGGFGKSSTLAALDMGSSKISCLIGRLTPQGVKVIGLGQTISRGIQSGAVIDFQEAERAIRLAVDAAERMADVSVDSVWVSTTGGRPQTLTAAAQIQLQSGQVQVSDVAAAHATAVASLDFAQRATLHLHGLNASVDGLGRIADPVGLHGQNLSVEIGATTIDPAVLTNLSFALNRAHLNVSGMVLAPYAAAKVALTPDEAKLGTLLVDIGAQVTSLSYIVENKLQAATSINLGSQSATHDLAHGLSTTIAHAERLKTLWGTVLEGGHGDEEAIPVPLAGEKGPDSLYYVHKSTISNILRPRFEELLEQIDQRLATPSFASAQAAKVVLSGGGSQLTGLSQLAAQKLRRQIREGSCPNLSVFGGRQGKVGFCTALGTLVHAAAPEVELAIDANAGRIANSNEGYARRVGRWLKEAI